MSLSITFAPDMPAAQFAAAVRAAAIYTGNDDAELDAEPQQFNADGTAKPKRTRRTKAEMEAARAAEAAAAGAAPAPAPAAAVPAAAPAPAFTAPAAAAAPSFDAPAPVADANSLFGGFAAVAPAPQPTEPPATLADIQGLVQQCLAGGDVSATTPKLQAAFAKFGAVGFSTLKPEHLDPMRAEVREILKGLGK